MSLLLTQLGRPRTRSLILIFASLVILAAFLPSRSAVAQPGRSAKKETFEGIWRAGFHGKNFMVLTLRLENGTFSGSVRMMDVHFDLEGTGEIDQVTGELSEAMKLTNIRAEDKRLLFDFQEEGDPDAVHWRMERTGPGKALLQWIDSPKGLTAQPIALVRDAGNR